MIDPTLFDPTDFEDVKKLIQTSYTGKPPAHPDNCKCDECKDTHDEYEEYEDLAGHNQ